MLPKQWPNQAVQPTLSGFVPQPPSAADLSVGPLARGLSGSVETEKIKDMNFYRVERENLTECGAVFINVFNKPPWNESWETEDVAQRLENCYQTPGFYGLIVKVSDEITGFAVGYIEQWDKSKLFYLKEMCVVSKQQRRGIGTALINALEENLKNEGVEKLYLHTARDTFAQSFYEKQDFYVSAKMIMMTKWLNSK